MLDLARRPNAVIKVSGACTLSREPYPFPDIWDPLARVFETWGFDRCLWGTDWTRAFAVVNYEQAVEPFRRTGRLSDSDRAMLMGRRLREGVWLVAEEKLGAALLTRSEVRGCIENVLPLSDDGLAWTQRVCTLEH